MEFLATNTWLWFIAVQTGLNEILLNSFLIQSVSDDDGMKKFGLQF